MRFLSRDAMKVWRSVRYGAKGLIHAFRSDKSFRMEIVYGFPAYFIIGWLLAPLEKQELIWYVFSYTLILVIELVNTAFETMLARLHPEEHELIGKTKDIAAGAVLLSFAFAAFVLGALVLERFITGTNVVAPLVRPFV